MRSKIIILLTILTLSLTSLCHSYDTGVDLIWGNTVPYDCWDIESHDFSCGGATVYVGSYIGNTDKWYFHVGGIFLSLHADSSEGRTSSGTLGVELVLRREFKVLTPVHIFVGVNTGLSYMSEKELPELYGHTVGNFGTGGGIIFPIGKSGWNFKYELRIDHRSNPFENHELGWNILQHRGGVFFGF